MLALLCTCLLVAVAVFIRELFHAYKYAPRGPSGAFTHHSPMVYEPVGGWWVTPGVFTAGLSVIGFYVLIVIVLVVV